MKPGLAKKLKLGLILLGGTFLIRQVLDSAEDIDGHEDRLAAIEKAEGSRVVLLGDETPVATPEEVPEVT